MPTIIERDEVRRLVVEEGAQLVEVLPDREYEDEHLKGAMNLPLKQLDREAAERLDRRRPVITYCHDYL
jgi:rhodanese-related sulfurtransferase